MLFGHLTANALCVHKVSMELEKSYRPGIRGHRGEGESKDVFILEI